MKANYKKALQRAQLPRHTMGRFLQRATVDEHIDKKVREYEAKRQEELSAYASAVDATLLYTLHETLGLGKKRLRRVWEAMIRNRIAFREFYRDGASKYEEQPTGQNIEDFAIHDVLKRIGVDVKAWEAEPIIIDPESGAVSFGTSEGGA